MSTLSLSVTSPTSTVDLSVTIADADMATMIVAYREVYGQPIQAVDTNGNPEVDGDGNPVMVNPTDSQVVQAAVAGILQGVLSNVMKYQQQQAATTAAAAVQPIAFTLGS